MWVIFCVTCDNLAGPNWTRLMISRGIQTKVALSSLSSLVSSLVSSPLLSCLSSCLAALLRYGKYYCVEEMYLSCKYLVLAVDLRTGGREAASDC